METREIVEKLKLENDLNQLSVSELANKYLCNKESYDKFLEKFSTRFLGNPLFQLRTYTNYKKITDIISSGNVMYPDKDNEEYEKAILKTMDYNIRTCRLETKRDDELQAIYLFDEAVGQTKVKKPVQHEDLIKEMVNVAIRYENRDGNSIKDLKNYVDFIQYNYTKEDQKKALIKYRESHSLLDECNNIFFLHYANYILRSYSNRVDEDFINDVKDVISASLALEKAQLSNPYGNFRDYNKVAKFALKNIRKIEKEKEKNLRK